MKIILLTNIKKLGQASDAVQVKRGFGRYLINSRQALYATNENIKLIEQQKERIQQEVEVKIEESKKILEILADIEIKFSKKAQENGKLFGSVTKKDILVLLNNVLQEKKFDTKKAGITVDNINLAQPIKTIGEFEIPLEFHEQIGSCSFKVKILNEDMI